MSSRYAYDDEDYYDDRRQYRGGPGSVQTRARTNREEEPDYYREEIVTERGKGNSGPRRTDMIYRGRDDSVEDIERDFPPPGRRRQSRARSVGTRRYSDDYSDDDRYTQYSRRSRGTRRGGGRDYDSEYSRSPPPKDRRKSGIEDVLGGLGLGGIAAALTGKKDHDDDRSVRSRSRAASRARSRRGSRSSSRSRGGRHETERKWAQAAQAALIAGAVEAFRSRKEPGPWTGDKGKRIATAAIGAGGIDGLLDRNPNEKSKRHLAEAVIGGLAANRLANGPRSQSRGRNRDYSPDGSRAPSAAPSGLRARSKSIIDRFRGRSQSRPRSIGPDGSERGGGGGNNNGIKTLAAGGALAAAGKAIYDRVRSKSRNRGRSRSGSRASSADSYVPSRKNRRRRRQPRGSIRSPPPTDSPRDLAAGPTARGRDPSARGRGIDDYNPNNGNGNGARDALVAGGAGAGAAALGAQSNQGGERNGGGGGANGENSTKGADATDQVSESSSTTDMENKRKRMKGKELLTAGLATIATIHAAHGVYSSMESHEKRHKLVAEGEMSPEEARKKQTKAWVQDAAAVGIAALGIKGAFSEWKEMNEQRREIHEIEKRKRDRRKRRERLERQKEEQRQERLMQLAQHNPQLAMLQSGIMQQQPGGRNGAAMPMPQFPMQQFQQGGGGGGGGGEVDQSGNPYASRS